MFPKLQFLYCTKVIEITIFYDLYSLKVFDSVLLQHSKTSYSKWYIKVFIMYHSNKILDFIIHQSFYSIAKVAKKFFSVS